MAIIGRQQVDHPALGTAGGSSLHTSMNTMYLTFADNYVQKYQEETSIADSTTIEVDHNFGAAITELAVLIYSGTGATKTLVPDAVDAGWVIAAKAGDEETILEVTTPGSGGPHTFSAIVVDCRLLPSHVYALLANTPSNPVAESLKTWFDDNKRGLVQDSAGGLQPLSFLGTAYTSSSGNLVPGVNTLVRTNIGISTQTTPATIANYDILMVTDAGRNANSNNITIGRNGNTINGAAEDYIIAENGGWVILIGDSSNSDWIVLAASQAGSSESGTNYFENGSMESNAVDGVAASGSVSPTIGEETTTPLYGARSSKITSGAGTGIIDYNIGLIDNGVVEAQITTQISAHLKTDALVADGDWTVGVYDTVGAAYVVQPTDLIADTINIYRTPYVPLFVTADRYKLRLEFTDTTAGRVLINDKLNMTPDSNSALMAFEQKTVEIGFDAAGLISSAAPGWGLNEAVGHATMDSNGQYRLICSGGGLFTSAASVSLTFSGVTSRAATQNHAFAASSASDAQVLRGVFTANSNVFEIDGASPNVTAVRWFLDIPLGANKPTWFDDNLDDNKVNLLIQDVVQANVKGGWTITDTAYTTDTPIDFDTEISAEMVGTWANTNGTITFPAAGTYEVATCVSCSSAWGNNAELSVYVNAVKVKQIDQTPFATALAAESVAGSCNVTVSKGDTLSIRVNATETLVTTAYRTYLSIIRTQDYGAFDPIAFALATDTRAGLVTYYKTEAISQAMNNSDGTMTGNVSRVGNIVTVAFDAFNVTVTGALDVNAISIVPAEYRTARTIRFTYIGRVNGTQQVLYFTYTAANGSIIFVKDIAGNNFSGGETFENVQGYSFSYVL